MIYFGNKVGRFGEKWGRFGKKMGRFGRGRFGSGGVLTCYPHKIQGTSAVYWVDCTRRNFG